MDVEVKVVVEVEVEVEVEAEVEAEAAKFWLLRKLSGMVGKSVEPRCSLGLRVRGSVHVGSWVDG